MAKNCNDIESEKYIDSILKSERIKIVALIGVAIGLAYVSKCISQALSNYFSGKSAREIEKAKQVLIQGFKEYDAIHTEAHSDVISVRKITGNKKEYINLLLLADEQEDMIDKYLERGEMFVLDDNGIKAECVVTREVDNVCEIKNIAVLPDFQRRGYGKLLIDFLFFYYSDCIAMTVGTGDVPSSLAFYRKCGFTESHRIKSFFIDNYDHPMYEDGIQLVDMVYLIRKR